MMRLKTAIALALLSFFAACGQDENKQNPEPNNSPPKQDQLGIIAPDEGVKSENGAFFAALSWEQGPDKGKESIALVTFADEQRLLPQSVTNVSFVPWMTIHGHGQGNRKVTITPVEGHHNVFRVSGIFFIMSGPWDLRIEASVNGDRDKLAILVDVP